MNTNIEKLMKLNSLVTASFRRRHIIVLDPKEKNKDRENLSSNIIYDKIEWKIPEKIRTLVSELSQNNEISNEDKILAVYEKICKDYVYDDNILSYIQKIDDDSYALPDWYGRDIGEEWEKNREQHNRRVCYEVSRYLAKALTELFKDNDNYSVSILWDKSLTHYFVGLTCDEYSITLDSDDFNNIKDLTRIKTGLTLEGIVVLNDNNHKIKNAIDKFNTGRYKESIKSIEHESEESKSPDQNEERDEIRFLKNAIEILQEKYNVDSQGIYEYIKEIVDVTLGPEARKKVWKEIKENNKQSTRYIRCLIIDVHNQKYVVDVDQTTIRTFNEEEFKKEDREFIPYKELLSEELINYRSRKEERYDGR